MARVIGGRFGKDDAVIHYADGTSEVIRASLPDDYSAYDDFRMYEEWEAHKEMERLMCAYPVKPLH